MPKNLKPFKVEIEGHPVTFRFRFGFWKMRYYVWAADSRQKVRLERCTKTITQAAAKAFAREVILSETGRTQKPSLDLQALFDQCATAKLAEKRQKGKTASVNRGRAKRTVKWFATQGIHRTEQMTLQAARQFKVHLIQEGLQPKTVNNTLSVLKDAFKWAHRDGRIDQNPVFGLDLIRAEEVRDSQKRPRIFEDEELTNILAAARAEGSPWFEIICVLACTGIRRGELVRLRVSDVEVIGEKIRLHIDKAKWGKRRTTPVWKNILPGIPDINPIIRDLIAERSPSHYVFNLGDPRVALNPDLVSARLNGVLKRAGLMDIDQPAHTFRHSLPVKLLRQGVSPLIVQAVMGHSEFKTTLIYIHLSGVDLQDAEEINERAVPRPTIAPIQANKVSNVV